jgi:hypothetical protein
MLLGLLGPYWTSFTHGLFQRKRVRFQMIVTMSYTVYDRKLFAFVQIAHGHCDELCVIQIISYD